MKIQLNFYSCLYDSMFQKLITLDANDVTKLIDSLSEVSEETIKKAKKFFGSVSCETYNYYSLLTHEHKLRYNDFGAF